MYFSLRVVLGFKFRFTALAVQKEELTRSKIKHATIKLGSEEFSLASHGTSSGYPYVMENKAFVSSLM